MKRVITHVVPGESYFGWRLDNGDGFSVAIYDSKYGRPSVSMNYHWNENPSRDWSYTGCELTESGNCTCGGSYPIEEKQVSYMWERGENPLPRIEEAIRHYFERTPDEDLLSDLSREDKCTELR
jgi:hypothetical protein